MTGAAAHLVAFLVLGAHMVVPWRAADQPLTARRSWALIALPALLAALLIGGWHLATHPDALLQAGWGSRSVSTLIVRALGVTLPILALADLVLLIGWRKLEDLGWRLNASLALVASLACGGFLELLRTGEGPWSTRTALAVAAMTFTLVALAAGEALIIRTAERSAARPRFALLAAAAIPTYFYFLPTAVQRTLWTEGWGITALACSVLFALARWLPARLRRPAVFAAVVLWSLFLGIAGEISSQLPHLSQPPMSLPGI